MWSRSCFFFFSPRSVPILYIRTRTSYHTASIVIPLYRTRKIQAFLFLGRRHSIFVDYLLLMHVRTYMRTRYQYHSRTFSSMYQKYVICGIYVRCTAVWYCFWLLLSVSYEYSTGSSVLHMIRVCLFRYYNTYQVCESAAVWHNVYIPLLELLLLLLLLLFVIVHLPPEVFFIQQGSICNRRTILTHFPLKTQRRKPRLTKYVYDSKIYCATRFVATPKVEYQPFN